MIGFHRNSYLIHWSTFCAGRTKKTNVSLHAVVETLSLPRVINLNFPFEFPLQCCLSQNAFSDNPLDSLLPSLGGGGGGGAGQAGPAPRMLAPGYYSQECNAHKPCDQGKHWKTSSVANLVLFKARYRRSSLTRWTQRPFYTVYSLAPGASTLSLPSPK